MKKQTVIGICVGVTLGTAAAVAGALAVRKIINEIKTDLNECSFTSPNGDNMVTLTYGSSKFAKGLTFIKVQGSVESGNDDCKLILFAKDSPDLFCGEWKDDEHFRLLVGNGKCKQCCDVSFEGEKIIANYYLRKADAKKELVDLSISNN
jgi:hypothetical protein